MKRIPTTSTQAFLEGLRDHGYVEGQSVLVEWRFADNRPERLPEFITDLIGLGANVIVAAGVPAAHAAQKATSEIPIVFLAVNDPVASGLVASLARPVGNITGVTNINVELARKRLAVLKEASPRAQKIGILYHPVGFIAPEMRELEAAARALQVTLHVAEIRHPEHFEAAFDEFAKSRIGAAFVPPQAVFCSHRRRLGELALRTRIPLMGWVREWADEGAVISYGPSNPDMQRRAGGYVARILQGARPSDLRVEQPTRFELVINLKSLKALGHTIPPSLFIQADHVIE